MEGTRTDAELGAVRWCGRCEEWWPDDREFFYYRRHEKGSIAVAYGQSYERRTAVTQALCKACQQERNARAYARRRGKVVDRPAAFVDRLALSAGETAA